MVNKSIFSNNFIDKLENECILSIENELEIFFLSCKKSAYAYSCMISKDLNSYNQKTFEEIVLSPKEIECLIDNILSKINIEIKKYIDFFIIDKEYIYLLKNIDNNCILQNTISEFKTTQKITKTCEKVIDKYISKTLKSCYSNPVSNYFIKKNNFGEKILGNNNSKNQVTKYQEKIYNQIEGILLNTKIDIRNELIKTALKNINDLKNYNKAISIYEIA